MCATEDLGAFARSVAGGTARVEESLGGGYVRLRVEEAERRQAKHDIQRVEDVVVELLRNARDAGATHIYVATIRDGGRRVTCVLDDGCGIPQKLQESVFEARVTSKLNSLVTDRWGVHGRGMALYSIRENAEDARVTASAPGAGCAIRVVTDVARLPERADQSTWPRLGKNDDGERGCTRGPHNIARTCCEFALEEHGRCQVYLGSPAEVLATVRARTRRHVGTGTDDGEAASSVLDGVSSAAGAGALLAAARSLGLEVSERTAHRVTAGEVRPLPSVYARLVGTARPARRDVSLMQDHRSLRVSDEDLASFSQVMEADFPLLGDAYYLVLKGRPKVTATRGKVVVTFDVQELD